MSFKINNTHDNRTHFLRKETTVKTAGTLFKDIDERVILDFSIGELLYFQASFFVCYKLMGDEGFNHVKELSSCIERLSRATSVDRVDRNGWNVNNSGYHIYGWATVKELVNYIKNNEKDFYERLTPKTGNTRLNCELLIDYFMRLYDK